MFLNIISIFFLFVAGIGLALASAYFGIHGFLDSFPLPEFFYGILYLGIILEIAKNVAAIFLFHKSKDSNFPFIMKFYMWIALLITMILSAYFTYAHLSVPMATYNTQQSVNVDRVNFIETRLLELTNERNQINTQVAQLPENFVRARRELLESFTPRLNQISEEENTLRNTLNELRNIDNSDVKDPFAFTNFMGQAFNVDGKFVYTIIILLLVAIIDPMALMLTISATYILEQTLNNRKKEVKPEVQEKIVYKEKVVEVSKNKFTDYLDSISYSTFENEFLDLAYPDIPISCNFNICVISEEQLINLRKNTLQIAKSKNIDISTSGKILFTSIKRKSTEIN